MEQTEKQQNTPRKQLVIGLDLGTSSSKVCYRWVGDREAMIFSSPHPAVNLPWFCTPTTMAKINGDVQFGLVFEEIPETYLKLALLNSVSKPGEWGEPELRAAAYLGWLLELVSKDVCERFRITGFRPVLNIGAPMAYYKEGQGEESLSLARDRYSMVAGATLATTSNMGGLPIVAGLSPSKVAERVREGENNAIGDLVHVMPESIAPMVSYEKDTRSEDGVFSIVDIGAGTTEVAVGWLSHYNGNPHVQCNKDSTIQKGATHFQETVSCGNDEGIRNFLEGWWKQWIETWVEGREIERGNPTLFDRWEDSNLFFTGGGGMDPRVKDFFVSQAPPGEILHIRKYEPEREVLVMKDWQGIDRSGFQLLAVAHGLSYHRMEWPQWYSPGQADVYRVETHEPIFPDEPTALGWL